jgi:hypothetical protein
MSSETRTSIKLDELQPDTDYIVYVWAVTSAGGGPSKSAVTKTRPYSGQHRSRIRDFWF